jgi:dienelactone hydrolase
MYKPSEINGEDFLLGLCERKRIRLNLDGFDTDSFKAWQSDKRNEIANAIGLDKLTVCNDKAELEESVELDGYTRSKYILPTLSGLKMPLYVLTPNKCNGRAMLAIHGHGCYGKEGIVGNMPEEIPVKASNKEAFALDLAERGYIVVCPDLLGSGERITGLETNKGGSACTLLNDTLIALGLSLQGVIVAELMRAVDFALELNGNKHNKIGCCGFSGGGLFALFLTALCDKVEATAVSGYFHTLSDTVLQSNKCGCNFSPKLWETADCGVLAALVAPRRLYIELGDEDKLHGRSGLESVYEQLETAKLAYSLSESDDNLRLTLCNGGHRWYGTSYDFLDSALIK